MIETLQQMLGVQGVSVRFHGHVSRGTLFDALATARAAVFPSFAEAFALAPLEAMAVGCPTIYSRLGSGPELIDEGVHGLLIDPNHPREIAESLIRVLTDDRLAERLGTAGARHVRSRFSLEQAILRNVEFYERCVSRFTARGTDRAESADRQLAGAGCS
jgi:glycosyltransferase involved in cell wall biosynthesis